MPAVHLGKVNLHWCDECNVPLAEEGRCSVCGERGHKVKITPPGDVRPAFEHDIGLIRETIDRQWGQRYSEELLDKEKIILLNRCPSMDRMDEVIVDGEVIGSLRYSLKRKVDSREPYEFLLRPWDGIEKPKKGFVKVDQGAVTPIEKGGSVLNPGITVGDEDIEEGDEVIVLSPKDRVIAAGSALLTGRELTEKTSGKGVKSRWRSSEYEPNDGGQTWDDVLSANEGLMEERVNEARRFIGKKIQEYDLPAVVSYSGGKDSLATLLLLLESDVEPEMIFIDTGIELPETVENVEEVAQRYDLTLRKKEAEGGYWDNVDYFGPSARDYRWCCKTCKLGPTTKLIQEHYPEGVLSFIGQRRYESENRMYRGDTWKNPWVPGQIGVSPIQDWTALHVWIYIFSRDGDYNPWYERGFERIGCWPCPASDLAELDILREQYSEFERFEDVLDRYAERKDLPEEWVNYGLWRWIDVPEEMKRSMDSSAVVKQEKDGDGSIPSMEEILDDDNTQELLYIIGEEGLTEDNQVESTHRKLYDLYLKANDCVGCGICTARCPEDALILDDTLTLMKERCIRCEKCLEQCPVIEYRHRH